MKTTELIGHAQTLALNADLALKRAERAGLDVEKERARHRSTRHGVVGVAMRITLQGVVASMSKQKRAELAAIQTDPRARAALAESHAARPQKVRMRDVLATARSLPDGSVIVLAKGLALVCTPNARMHPQVEAQHRRNERETIARALAGVKRPAGPWEVVIVRQGPRRLDDDNATASAKTPRDAVAAWLGLDDGDARFRCAVQQEKTKGYGVRIEVRAVAEEAQ